MELKYSEKLSVLYHNIFNYPLTREDLRKWTTKKRGNKKIKVLYDSGFYFIQGRNSIIKKRLENEKYSKLKLKIAKDASRILSYIPTIKFVGITGALAMNNAGKQSDIDLIIVAKKGTLWTSRLVSYLVIKFFRFNIRNPEDSNEKDKLCLNMWLDESDLIWNKKDRNIYTAHEVLQIVPIINKDKTYEKFIWQNRWATYFWPEVKEVVKIKNKIKRNTTNKFIEDIAFKIQYLYMRRKITREIVTRTRAVFHPNDWGRVVINKLKV